MASFSAKSFERKLKEMSARQDSVQTVSLWLIHHRAHSKTVVSVWHDHVKKAKPDRRLILFYLANDVIQNSRKKGKEFSKSFGKVLFDSMSYLRDSQIRPSVERVLKIWQERKVFEKDVVQKLIAQLYRVSKSESKVETKTSEKKVVKPKRPVPAGFKVSTVIGAMVTMQEREAETQRCETKVSQMRLDASSSEGIKQLKDRAGGNRFSMEFEESSSKIEELMESLEYENQHRHILINTLEDSDSYYQAALKEATIIANAYRSFGNRLHAMKKKLDNKIRKFATAEKEAPVSAPKASFLASGLSGILKEVNKSPARSMEDGGDRKDEVETNVSEKEKAEEEKVEEDQVVEEEKLEEEPAVKEEKVTQNVDPTVDHVEVADMDIESDSEEEPSDSVAPQETPDTNSNTNGSTVSTPSLSTPAVTQTPSLTNDIPKDQPVIGTPSSSISQQFGYTMTADSTEDTADFSPASRDSAPSPEGSPDLNLEQYDERLEVSAANTLNVMGGVEATASEGSVVSKSSTDVAENVDEKTTGASDARPPDTVNLIAQLISKTRRQHNESSAESSPQRNTQPSVEQKPDEKPLLTLIDSLFPVLRTLHGPNGNNREPIEEKEGQFVSEQESDQSSDNHANSTPVDNDTRIPNTFQNRGIRDDEHTLTNSPVAHTPTAQATSGAKDFNDNLQEGDNTPEHGSETPEFGEDTPEFGESAPIIIRSSSELHHHPGPDPSHGGLPIDHARISIEHGRIPIEQGHAPIEHGRIPIEHGRTPIEHGRTPIDRSIIDGRQFPRERVLPRPCGMEPSQFVRNEMRRPIMDDAMMDERQPRRLNPPEVISPRMAPPPDWQRWPPRDELGPRDRGERQNNGPMERRQPFPPIDRRHNPHGIDRMEDLRPPVPQRGEREEFYPPENITAQPREFQREFRPTDPRVERRLPESRVGFPVPSRSDEGRPMRGRDEFFETEADFPPRPRPAERGAFEARNELHSLPYAREEGPLDGRAEFHPVDRREDMIERRDEYRNIGHNPRGGHFPPQNRPRPYRDDTHTRGFHPRFSRPRGHPMGGPRGYQGARLKRPGPPFNPDAAKRPHF